MQIVTAQQMKAIEAAANAAGLTYDAMMEQAGKAVAEAIDIEFGAAGRQIMILVGAGNNGGDGLVAARYLSDMGATVSLYLWRRGKLDEDANWQRLEGYPLTMFQYEQDTDLARLTTLLNNSALIVDALLGTGVSRPVQGALATILTHCQSIIEQRRAVVSPTMIDPIDPDEVPEIGPAIVAVDLPSGLYSDTGVLDPLTLPADLTVTFAAPKYGHVTLPGAAYVGQLLIADIGIDPGFFPPDLPVLAAPPCIASLLPERPMSGHKGTFGKTLIVGGCRNYAGAPILSATAAYRVGTGLVTVAVPEPIYPLVATNLIEATYLPLTHQDGALTSQAAEELSAVLQQYTALLIGPGLSQTPGTKQFLDALLSVLAKQDPGPLCIFDADALNLLAQEPTWLRRLPQNSILTPHPGEMSRLVKKPIAEIESKRLAVAKASAQQWGLTLVYKGAFTIVTNEAEKAVIMPFANPALSTAGSGDVLAGCITGLVAQGLYSFEAAVVGAYLHGLAGELARERLWEAGVMARDLLHLLPLAFKEVSLSSGDS